MSEEGVGAAQSQFASVLTKDGKPHCNLRVGLTVPTDVARVDPQRWSNSIRIWRVAGKEESIACSMACDRFNQMRVAISDATKFDWEAATLTACSLSPCIGEL